MGGYGDMTQEGMELEDEGDKRAITQEMQKNRGMCKNLVIIMPCRPACLIQLYTR